MSWKSVGTAFKRVGKFLAGAFVGAVLVAALGPVGGVLAGYGFSRLFRRAGEPYLEYGVYSGVIWKIKWIGIALGVYDVARRVLPPVAGSAQSVLSAWRSRRKAHEVLVRRELIYPAGTLHPQLRTVVRGRILVRYTPR